MKVFNQNVCVFMVFWSNLMFNWVILETNNVYAFKGRMVSLVSLMVSQARFEAKS